jgi:eukaryotic-like serine/threonine-protein kinase
MIAAGSIIADRYEVEAHAASGAIGAIWRARDRLTGATVALKVIAADGEDARRFQQEVRALEAVSHDGVVRYVDHGRTAASLYLAMEWLDGPSLADRLAAGPPLGVEPTIALGRRLARALAAAHAGGVVHRDLKPANIVLIDGALDRATIVDFGLARVGGGAAVTRTGTVLGTPGYMAPEQARGQRDVGPRVDVFALGCVLFECIAGRPPFQADHLWAVLAKVLFDDAPTLTGAPPAVATYLARMLARDPAARPDAAEVNRDLGALDPAAAAPAAGPRRALSQSEQRLVSVIMAGTPDDGDADVAMPALPPDAAMRQVAAAHGASLERITPGLVVAVLDAEVATDQAAQAARLALALRTLSPTMPIVLCTGHGVVDQRYPVGEVIDRGAALLATPAPPPAVSLDPISAGLLDTRFEVRTSAAGAELHAEREPSGSARLLLGRPTRCVGRDTDLRILEALFDATCAERRPGAALVVGPAGIGKSRLRYELASRLRGRHPAPTIWVARCDPTSAGSPFAIAAQLVRTAARAADGEPLALRQAKIRAMVSAVAPAGESARISAFLCELAGASTDDEAAVTARREPAAMHDELQLAWEDWLGAACAAGPVALVLDDLHWGDLPSVKLIDAALRNLRDHPMFVLALARPDVSERFPRLWAGRELHELRLGALSARAARRLVHEILGDAPDAVVGRLVDQAGGNPFFLEELIRAEVDGRRGRTDTVLAMLTARLQAMEEEVRRVLRAASVFGEVFWRGGVAALIDDPGLDRTLTLLEQRELVSRRPRGRLPGEPEYVFRHGLIRDAAYAMLVEDDRVLGHRLAAEWLERVGDGDALRLAECWERGGEPRRAVGWFRRAAEGLLEGDDLAGAIAAAERGLAGGAARDDRIALLTVISHATDWRGDNTRAAQLGREVRALCAPGSDAWARACRTGLQATSADEAEDLAAAFPPHPERWSPALRLAAARVLCLCAQRGRDEAAAALEAALARTGAHAEPAVAAWVAYAAAWRAYHAGDPGGFVEHAERAIPLFEAIGDRRRALVARINRAANLVELGLPAEAEPELRLGIAMCDRLGIRGHGANARSNLAHALRLLGRLDEGAIVARESIEMFHREPIDADYEATTMVYLARILERSGDRAAALAQVDAAIALVGDRSDCRALRAHLLLADGRIAEALADARVAIEPLPRDDSCHEEALVRLTWARALDAAGDRAAARVAIGAARDRLLARAARISDPARRASFLANVGDNAGTLALARDWAP